MQRKDHFISTFLFSLIIYKVYGSTLFHRELTLIEILILSIATAYFSYLPDIDIKYTMKINRHCSKKRLNIFGRMRCFLLKKFILPLVKHRTYTHSLLILGLFICAQYLLLHYIDSMFFESLLYYFFVIVDLGIFLHIVEDMFTTRGVPLFYPILTRNFRFFSFNSSTAFGTWMIRITYTILFLVLFYLTW